MNKLFEGIQKNFKVNYKKFTTDNLIFKLHYRLTTWMLFLMTVMITSQELIGEHIKCISDKGVPEHIINRFCYFTSTFTVIKYLNNSLVDAHAVAHPGVGAMGINSGEPIKRHAYYQWVPFVLFGQGLMFYLPHLIWKTKEGGRLQKLVSGLEYAAFATDRTLTIGKNKTPTKSDIAKKMDDLKTAFDEHLIVNRSWTFWLVTCEVFNAFNLIFQVYITNAFLGGQFFNLGRKLMAEGLEATVDVLDVVFPKMTKCTFNKIGPSGTLQSHDAMCVMALNIINEKVYSVLWFWYLVLFVATMLGIIWRILTIFLHNRSATFNRMVFYFTCNGHINVWKTLTVTNYCNYKDWLFLVYLSKNMDSIVFNEFLNKLARDLQPVSYEPSESSSGKSLSKHDLANDYFDTSPLKTD